MRWRWEIKRASTEVRREPLCDMRGRLVRDMGDISPHQATADGVVAIGGGELSISNLQIAYRNGIFPWPHEDYPLLWFSPDPRAILDLSHLHIPKSLAKERRKEPFTFTIDRAFDQVMLACGLTARPNQQGTWITQMMCRGYQDLHHAGIAHSVEAWDAEGNLAGGLYGVDSDGVFTGESMFYRIPYASKLSLLFLIDHLQARGSTWLDIQTMTPHFEALGATEIPRDEFLIKLAETQALKLKLFDPPPQA